MPLRSSISAAPPLAAWTSAFIAALVGFGGTVPLIVQAMRGLGADAGQVGSAVTALCLGIAVCGGLLSLRLRIPVVLAWSTPGAALLVASAGAVSWPVAIGAFLAAAAMMCVLAVVPVLERAAQRIPASVASAMLAGVLLPFCLQLFRTLESDALLVCVLLVVFVIARQRLPLYALLLVLGAGIAVLLLRGDLAGHHGGSLLGSLRPVAPRFDWRAVTSIGVPLFLVTLVSQNLPGLVVLRSAGYAPAPRPLLLSTGLATLLLAPFGAHGVNLAAITAAICTGSDAHPDAAGRWVVGVIYAGFYLLLALFSTPLVLFFLAMPSSAIAALTGIALIAPLSGAVEQMLVEKSERDAAILTFAATASGVSLLGVGSAFWGLLAGFAALAAKWAFARRN
ncbi:benzoate/H(+) symporter BenE family transporter [Novosphingobium resinovorum]|uniref:Benzoate transporter n=1 Tax=Novosphingobium resinovorum TaxID=158500 RepID=A0A031JWR8_9SPHN|nr:benzoate/H(+) symporter BenE family transporter [Novosphingobium resinovorum]AOR78634.1 benzoate transporter [Novosphingobium resinovorum]EZP80807.1 putative transporter [Novosphingobium resinovorum]